MTEPGAEVSMMEIIDAQQVLLALQNSKQVKILYGKTELDPMYIALIYDENDDFECLFIRAT